MDSGTDEAISSHHEDFSAGSSERLSLLEQIINSVGDCEGLSGKEIDEILEICLQFISPDSKTNDEVLNLALTLLSNVTCTEENSNKFLKRIVVSDESEAESILPPFKSALIAFLDHNPQLEKNVEDQADGDILAEIIDPWQHVASILCNITRLDTGRRILLRQSTGYMQQLTKQIRSANLVRRRGATATIRNCLFDVNVHWWMIYEVDVLQYILMPLVVATPFEEKERVGMDSVLWLSALSPEKKHEPDNDVLIMLLECILLLCQKRLIRDEMRRKKVYFICRNLDYQLHENEAASNVIFEIVNFLMREEDPSTPQVDIPHTSEGDGVASGHS